MWCKRICTEHESQPFRLFSNTLISMIDTAHAQNVFISPCLHRSIHLGNKISRKIKVKKTQTASITRSIRFSVIFFSDGVLFYY
mmetsp:Transcript_44853/g.83131  ORF Transcript_44853/g.83131 Transcript_44853/m.83131 type:complete len:84 (-) Transcript_44853:63-314(-)